MKVFEWDLKKNLRNQKKHRVSFEQAEKVFDDPDRVIVKDLDHSTKNEVRYFCIGIRENQICTVRFTYRGTIMRIIGAGYWRKERKIYEKMFMVFIYESCGFLSV